MIAIWRIMSERKPFQGAPPKSCSYSRYLPFYKTGLVILLLIPSSLHLSSRLPSWNLCLAFQIFSLFLCTETDHRDYKGLSKLFLCFLDWQFHMKNFSLDHRLVHLYSWEKLGSISLGKNTTWKRITIFSCTTDFQCAQSADGWSFWYSHQERR